MTRIAKTEIQKRLQSDGIELTIGGAEGASKALSLTADSPIAVGLAVTWEGFGRESIPLIIEYELDGRVDLQPQKSRTITTKMSQKATKSPFPRMKGREDF